MSTIALIISKISAMKGKADILEYCFIEKSFCAIQQWCAFQPSWCLTNPINFKPSLQYLLVYVTQTSSIQLHYHLAYLVKTLCFNCCNTYSLLGEQRKFRSMTNRNIECALNRWSNILHSRFEIIRINLRNCIKQSQMIRKQSVI